MSEFSSGAYWDERYQSGGNSGAGSYGRLQSYKAKFINSFIALNGVRDVLDFGTGDGAFADQVSVPKYTGVDISRTIIEKNKERFRGRDDLAFVHVDDVPAQAPCDLTLSVDVIYHLVEDEVFHTYMKNLFALSKRFVIVYASNHDQVLKRAHVRHRKFTDFVLAERPEWSLAAMAPNVYPYDLDRPGETSFADFHIFRQAGQSCTVFLPDS